MAESENNGTNTKGKNDGRKELSSFQGKQEGGQGGGAANLIRRGKRKISGSLLEKRLLRAERRGKRDLGSFPSA